MPSWPAAALPAVPERKRRRGGGTETTRKKVTVSKPDASVAVDDSEEGRGCIICLPHVRIRSENTGSQYHLTHTWTCLRRE